MKNSFRLVLGAAAAVLATSSFAQLPAPAGDHDAARQERMEAAYRDHQEAQAHPSTFSETARRDAHEAGHAVAHGARATGHAVEHGAEATGHAIKRGATATGHAIQHGAEATGHAIHRGVDKVTGKPQQ